MSKPVYTSSVFLGARSEEKYKVAAASLKADGIEGVEFVEIDIANQNSVEKAASEIAARTNGTLDGLVNNAGVGFVTRAKEQRVGSLNMD